MQAALAHLRESDAIMAQLIAQHGVCPLGGIASDPFHVLATSIISQQLSVRAADTIQGRLETLLGCPGKLQPQSLVAADPLQLRSAGLSTAKARWLQGLSRLVLEEQFVFDALQEMDDEAAIRALDALPGVGRWTAEMFLIFALGRHDIFSLGDVGLRRAIDRLYNQGSALDEAATRAITACWSPYRSAACWYLWRATDSNLLAPQ